MRLSETALLVYRGTVGSPVGRLAAAIALALVAIATRSSAALGCSGPPLTFDEVVSGSELIVEGEVEEVQLDGMAFRLAVHEIFKGSAIGATVRIGPTSDPGGRGCEVSLSEGDHVILGVVDASESLNSLATAVWFIAPDGSLSSPGSLWEVAPDVTELRAMLRDAIPDTAVPVPGTEGGPPFLLLGFVAMAVLAALARNQRWVRG